MKAYSCRKSVLLLVCVFCYASKISLALQGSTRRDVVLETITSAATIGLGLGVTCGKSAEVEASTEVEIGGLDCLLDLPELAPNKVRIFLCRHGQTENNRLRLVQGARVDPPINPTGREMAHRDGEVFSNLKRNMRKYPTLIVHSKLQRAKESAEEISRTMNNNESKSTVGLQTMNCLAEVDFGPFAEGKPIQEVRDAMSKVYGLWAIGKIDTVPELGGESGRNVISRVRESLIELTALASNNGGSIAAVSHSTFLRMLIGICSEMPLVKAALLEQKNGCINVIDVDVSKPMLTFGPKSSIFGGILSLAPEDAIFSLPSVEVVRINETRHLSGLV